MQITLNFDSSVANASARWVDSIEQAANFLDSIIPDPIKVNFDIGYGEVDGQALGQNVLGATADQGYRFTYNQLVGALKAHPTSTLDQQFLSTLPSTDPNQGQTWFVPSAEAKVLGLVPATSNTVDAFIGFTNTLPTYYDPARAGIPSNSSDLIGVALHELTHGLGRALDPGAAEPMNLMSYGANGRPDLNDSQMRFISFDGGRTNIGNLDTTSDPSDLAKGSQVNDPFDAYLAPGTDFVWTKTDTAVMQMLGFHVNIPSSASAVASALGNSSLSVNDFLPVTASNAPKSALPANYSAGASSMPDPHAHWMFPIST